MQMCSMVHSKSMQHSLKGFLPSLASAACMVSGDRFREITCLNYNFVPQLLMKLRRFVCRVSETYTCELNRTSTMIACISSGNNRSLRAKRQLIYRPTATYHEKISSSKLCSMEINRHSYNYIRFIISKLSFMTCVHDVPVHAVFDISYVPTEASHNRQL